MRCHAVEWKRMLNLNRKLCYKNNIYPHFNSEMEELCINGEQFKHTTKQKLCLTGTFDYILIFLWILSMRLPTLSSWPAVTNLSFRRRLLSGFETSLIIQLFLRKQRTAQKSSNQHNTLQTADILLAHMQQGFRWWAVVMGDSETCFVKLRNLCE